MSAAFWIATVILAAIALGFVLLPLRRRPAVAPLDASIDQQRQATLALLREQLAALDADLAAGTISADQHARAREDIERRAIDEAGAATTPSPAPDKNRSPNKGARAASSRPAVGVGATAIVLALVVPALAFGLYGYLGRPSALGPQAKRAEPVATANAELQNFETLVANLAKKMEGRPDDAQGWAMLGRSYNMLQRFPEARRALTRAAELKPDDAQVLVDLADAVAMTQNQSTAGEPAQLIERALKLEPDNLKALVLAGSAAFERKDFSAAIGYWERAQRHAEVDAELAGFLTENLQLARTSIRDLGMTAPAVPPGGPVSAAAAAAAIEPPARVAATATPAPGAKVSGRVTLAAALQSKIAPTDILFVFARAETGPRMPLAIIKRTATDLPFSFTLDDSSAMSPQLRLSSFERVVVGARISKSGTALPQSGDMQGLSAPVKIGTQGIELVIDSLVP